MAAWDKTGSISSNWVKKVRFMPIAAKSNWNSDV